MMNLKIALIATIITVVLITLCGIAIASAEIYPETAKVVLVDRDTDTVYVETFTGHVFSFKECEDWQEGDCASLIMDDNGTEKVFDDQIVMAQYGAWQLVNWQRGE